MAVPDSRPLAGIGILVTRPAHQAEPLAQGIEAAGGLAIRFPTLAILEPQDPQALATAIERLNEFDMAVFISPNAVHAVLKGLAGRPWPRQLAVTCVGPASAQALASQGIGPILTPRGRYDSESLLALPAMQALRDKRIIIFRGDGGRELLGATLSERGAQVSYVACYQRAKPEIDGRPLVARWAQGAIHLVSLTSVQALKNLEALIGASGQALLRRTPVVVVSERLAQACRNAGISADIITAQAADEGAMLEAILAWRAAQKSL